MSTGLSITFVTFLSVARPPDVYLFMIPTAQALEDIKADKVSHAVTQIQYSVSKRGRVFVNKFGAELQQGLAACTELGEEWNIGITAVLAFFAKDGQIMQPAIPTVQ